MNAESSTATAATNAAAAATSDAAACPPGGPSPPSQGLLVTVLNANDVLLGRGAPVIDNEGNIRFRQIVHTRRSEYLASTRRQEKDWIARQVMTQIKNRGGRFLRKIDITLAESQQFNLPEGAPAWTSVDEDAVLLKVKQAMRDRSLEDEEPRPRRRRRVRSNNVVLDDDLSLEEEKRAATRPRTEEQPSQNNHQQPAAATLASQGGLLADHTQQQPRNQQADLVNFLLQQQQHQHQGYHQGQQHQQHQSMMLAERQRQQHERQMAHLIEEHRLRNSLCLQGANVHHGGNFGGMMPSLRDIPASLGGGVGGIVGGGLSDITALAHLHSVGQPGGNMAMQHPSLNQLGTTTAPGMFGSGIADSRHHMASEMSSSPSGQGGRDGSSNHAMAISTSLGGQAGQAYAMAAAAARRSSAGSSQASTAGQVSRPGPSETLLDDSSQPDDAQSMKESSGELAIEWAFGRMNKNPGATLHGQYLKISLIEGCLLSVICSFGIPQWSTDDMTDAMFITSPAERQGKAAKGFTWADLSNLLKEKVVKLKSGDQSDEQSALAITASSNPTLVSSAVVLAESFTKDPKDLARTTIMLLEKMRIHSRLEQMKDIEHLPASNGPGPSSISGLRTNETRDLADISGNRGANACDMNVGRYGAANHHDHLLWEHLSAELGKWATLLDVASEGTGRPIAHSLFDITPKDLAEEEAVTPVAALDMTSSGKILAQVACLSRLGAIFQRQSSQEITDALKNTATKQHMAWVSRPTWWLQHDKESITRDVWLLENLASHGLAILDVPISSKLFPVACLGDAGLTKAIIMDRAIQLTVAIHEQVQAKKRVRVEQERASNLAALLGQPGERS